MKSLFSFYCLVFFKCLLKGLQILDWCLRRREVDNLGEQVMKERIDSQRDVALW